MHRFIARCSPRYILTGESVCWCRRFCSVLLWGFCGQERSARHLNQYPMVPHARWQSRLPDKRWTAGNREAWRRTNHRVVSDDSDGHDEPLRSILVPCRDGKLTNSSTGNVGRAHQRTSNRSWQKQHFPEPLLPGVVCRSRHRSAVFSSVSFASMVDEIPH